MIVLALRISGFKRINETQEGNKINFLGLQNSFPIPETQELSSLTATGFIVTIKTALLV